MSQLATIEDLSPSQLLVIRNSVAKDLNDVEFNQFQQICSMVGLNPFKKQIFAIVYNKNNVDKRSVAFITSIDGYRSIANRRDNYRPGDVVYTYDKELKSDTNPLGIDRAKYTCFRMDTNGNWNPVSGEAYWDEFAPIEQVWEYNEKAKKRLPTGEEKLSRMWASMPPL